MQTMPRWRNLLHLKNTIIQATTMASASNTLSNVSEFHSTTISYEKWKSKWNSDVRGEQQPSKDYIRYKIRQKRADTKKALKDLLFNGGCFQTSFEEAISERDEWDIGQADTSGRKDRSKSSPAARRAARAQHRRMKRRLRREKLYEDIDNPENIFHASFGSRWRTWTYWSLKGFPHESSTAGFEWKEHPNQRYKRQRESDIESETESHDESCVDAMYSERKILGLPPKVPLKIEDIKNAFRLSALKWHPDKHQGPSQAMAEEKFKHCVDAYKSLCNSLSTA